jgi:surfeit locus 1 family protein
MSIIKAIRQYRLISLNIASYHFNPGVISSFVTIGLLYIMMSLGFWQSDRAEFKDTLQQKIVERKKLSPVGFDELPGSSEKRRYLPVKFIGEFDSQHSFLLDNITLNGRVGYHVFTPVKINEFKTILVNRGFVPQGKTRAQLPEINSPIGEIKLQGLLDFTPSRTLLLAEDVQETSRWPVVLQYIDLTEISQLLGYELYDMVLWLNPNKAGQDTGSFEYDLPVLNLNAAKNSGYAFQWFAMSLALFIIYIVVNTKRDTK